MLAQFQKHGELRYIPKILIWLMSVNGDRSLPHHPACVSTPGG
jgi:hypothetical protein